MKHGYWKGLIAAFGLILAWGCHAMTQAESGQNAGNRDASSRSSETVLDADHAPSDVLAKTGDAEDVVREETAAAPEGSDETDVGDMAKLPEDWAYELMGKADAAQVALYEEAKNIVRSEAGYEGVMKKESRHFGDWYQIIFEPEELKDPGGAVLGLMKPRSFLVNMAEKHVIQAGDFRRAKPLFDALVAAFPKKGASEQGRFVGEIASAVSTVAFGHSEYEVGNPDGEKPPYVPQVSERMDKFILEYDVSVGRGENLTYDRCRLTVLTQGISFSANQEE